MQVIEDCLKFTLLHKLRSGCNKGELNAVANKTFEGMVFFSWTNGTILLVNILTWLLCWICVCKYNLVSESVHSAAMLLLQYRTRQIIFGSYCASCKFVTLYHFHSLIYITPFYVVIFFLWLMIFASPFFFFMCILDSWCWEMGMICFSGLTFIHEAFWA